MEKKTETLTVVIDYKAANKKGFKIEGDKDQWYTANKEILDDLAKVEKGDKVEITFVKNGVFRNVSKIEKVKSETKSEAKEEPKSGFTCEDCGKELKDDKYKKCFMCNKKSPPKTKVIDEPEKEKDTGWKSKSNYGSTEDISGKEVGCAANCAAQILSGCPLTPEETLETFRVLFNGILEHIRANK